MTTSLDEQRVEEQEACRGNQTQSETNQNYTFDMKHRQTVGETGSCLSEWVHCCSRLPLNSSSPRFSRPPTREAAKGCWSMFAVTEHYCCWNSWNKKRTDLERKTGGFRVYLSLLSTKELYLEEVEFVIVEDPIIVQVWYFEDSGQSFYTKWLHLIK